MVRVYKGELYRAVMARYPEASALGSLATINVVSYTPYGRAVWLDLVGTTGRSTRLRADDVRLAWNMSLTGKPTASTRKLYSMNCTIIPGADWIDFANGHGFGHGVGLCQWARRPRPPPTGISARSLPSTIRRRRSRKPIERKSPARRLSFVV